MERLPPSAQASPDWNDEAVGRRRIEREGGSAGKLRLPSRTTGWEPGEETARLTGEGRGAGRGGSPGGGVAGAQSSTVLCPQWEIPRPHRRGVGVGGRPARARDPWRGEDARSHSHGVGGRREVAGSEDRSRGNPQPSRLPDSRAGRGPSLGTDPASDGPTGSVTPGSGEPLADRTLWLECPAPQQVPRAEHPPRHIHPTPSSRLTGHLSRCTPPNPRPVPSPGLNLPPAEA